MINIENNRLMCNNKNLNGLIQVFDNDKKFSGGLIRVRPDATNMDCIISNCIFEPKDNDYIGVECSKDGIHLFYEEGNGKINEFIGYAIVPTEKFVWMESQMHWHRIKGWFKGLLKRKVFVVKSFNRGSIQISGPSEEEAKE